MSVNSVTMGPKITLTPLEKQMSTKVLSSEETVMRLKQDQNLHKILSVVPEDIQKSRVPTYTILRIPKDCLDDGQTQFEIINYTARRVLFDKSRSLTVDGSHALSLYGWGRFSQFTPDDCQSVFYEKDGKYYLVNRDINTSKSNPIQKFEYEETQVGFIYHAPEMDYEYSKNNISLPSVKELENQIVNVGRRAKEEFLKRLALRRPNSPIQQNLAYLSSITPVEFANPRLDCDLYKDEFFICSTVKGFIIKFWYYSTPYHLHTDALGKYFRSPDINIASYPREVLILAIKKLSEEEKTFSQVDLSEIKILDCEENLCYTGSLDKEYSPALSEQRYLFIIELNQKTYKIIVNDIGEKRDSII